MGDIRRLLREARASVPRSLSRTLACGQAAKACNPITEVANVAAIPEAMNLAARFGVDRVRLPTALAGGIAGIARMYAPPGFVRPDQSQGDPKR